MTSILQLIIPLAYAAFFIFLIHKMSFFKTEGITRTQFSLFFIIKIIAGTALWWIYTFYYTNRESSDIYKYFDDSRLIFNELYAHPSNYFRMLFGIADNSDEISKVYAQMNSWYKHYTDTTYTDSRLVIRFNALVALFSFGIYHVHTVFICFLSLIGTTFVYKAFLSLLFNVKRIFALFIFLFPSLLFWSSGVLKEGILFFALGCFVYCLISYSTSANRKKIMVGFVVSISLLLFLKIYVLLSLLPGILVYVWVKRYSKNVPLKYFASVVTLLLLFFTTAFLPEKYNPARIICKKQTDFINAAKGGIYLQKGDSLMYFDLLQKDSLIPAKENKFFYVKAGTPYRSWEIHHRYDTVYVSSSANSDSYKAIMNAEKAGSSIAVNRLEPNAKSILMNAPAAIFNCLFRPLPGEADSALMLMSSAENIFMLLFIILVMVFRKKKTKIAFNEVYFCLFFILLLSAISGLTTPILGALVRYKIPALLFLFIAGLLVLDEQKLFALLSKARKKIFAKRGASATTTY